MTHLKYSKYIDFMYLLKYKMRWHGSHQIWIDEKNAKYA